MTHDPMTPLTPPTATAMTIERVKSKWGPLAKLPLWAKGSIVAAAILLAILLWQLVVALAAVVLITAIVAVVKNQPTWIKFASRKHAIAAIIISAVIAVGFSSVGTAVAGKPSTSESAPAGIAALPSKTPSATPRPTLSAQVTAKAAATPSPSPTPVVVVKQEAITEAVPFGSSQQEDWNLATGTTRVAIAGVAGTRTITYDVTYTDGVETARVEVSNIVTVEPIHEVVSVGMYTPPAAFAGRGDSDCNSNYADACVPNDPNDVDCAWGTGNGPSYFDGVARVVGNDVYDLDRDNDGYACERD